MMSKKKHLTILVVIVIISLIAMVAYNFMNQQKEEYAYFTERLNVYYSDFSNNVEKLLEGKDIDFSEIDVNRLEVIRQLAEMANSGNIYAEKKSEEIEKIKADIDVLYDDIVSTYYLKNTTETVAADDEILNQKDSIDGQIENLLDEAI